MQHSMFHIFRNSPLGRENLLQSLYFCRTVGNLTLNVYQPVTTKFVIYCENETVSVDLDASYLQYASTAGDHLDTLLADAAVPWKRFVPEGKTASTLPDIPGDWTLMACPRVISEKSNRIGLGYLGSKVRSIMKVAPFAAFIPCQAYKPWTRVGVFFGGSELGLRAVKLARAIAKRAEMPLTIYTQLDGLDRQQCQQMLVSIGLDDLEHNENRRWVTFETKTLKENLYAVSSESLVVLGVRGDSPLKKMLFGHTLEMIQSELPNPLLLVGPNYQHRL